MTDDRPSNEVPTRYAPNLAFPPYTYVPGLAPHPESDPAGHAYGHARPNAEKVDDATWPRSSTYLHAIDLFNHGYYWEAHEAWEALWHACGRRGAVADLLKGLIKLAAAGVKVREGRPAGVASHARRAAELLRIGITNHHEERLGLRIDEAATFAESLAQSPPDLRASTKVDSSPCPAWPVFAFRLELCDATARD